MGAVVKKKMTRWAVAGGLIALMLIAVVSQNFHKVDAAGTSVANDRNPGAVENDRKAAVLPGLVDAEKFSDERLSQTLNHTVLDERQTPLADGSVKHEILIQVDDKHAYRRVEEIFGKDTARRKFASLARTEMVADHVLVHLSEEALPDALDELCQQYGATVERVLSDGRTLVIRLAGPSLDAVSEAIAYFEQAAGDVAYVEPDYIRHLSKTPNDTQYGELWGMVKISAPAAWDISTGNSAAIVAVLDTGMDMDHPDLMGNLWSNSDEIPGDNIDNDGNGYVDDVNGWDFVTADKDPNDSDGHGTHCAGTIGAVGNNASQVAGVCWKASIMPLRVGTEAGLADSDIVEGIRYAARNGAKVLSNSYGGPGFSQTMFDAISTANNYGCIFVAAAGNDASNNDLYPEYPAGYELPNVISVAATDEDDNLATFSNYGATSVDVAAPGVNIVSTWPGGGTDSLDGTSMACPHVAGALTLYASVDPGINPAEARQLLLQSADPVQGLTGKVVCGGRLNLQQLLAEGTDSDGDGMPDSWEQKFGFDPFDASDGGTNDFDGDFLTNVAEFQRGCNPTNSDTDADSLYDGWEIRYGFNALDVHTALPKLQYLGGNAAPNDASDIAVSGDYAYVADGVNGFRVFNIETPSAPQLIATLATSGVANGVTLSGSKAYVSDTETGLHVIDISTPALPTLLGSVEMTAYNCAVQGNYAYVAAGTSMLQVVNVSNPANPTIVGEFNNNYRIAKDVAISGNYVYLAMDGYVGRLSIANPTAPSGYLGYGVYGDAGKSNLESIHIDNGRVYLTQQNYGFSVYNLDLSFVARVASEGSASGIYEQGGLIYLADGAQCLIVYSGLGLPTVTEYDRYENVYARNVVFADGYAYVVGDNTGLHVFRASADLDADGLDDKWETDNFGSLEQDWTDDYDGDGIINWGEYLTGLVATNFDHDQDGDLLPDYDEVTVYNTDPRTPDTDGDGLSDYDEVMTNATDPFKADTDDDGLTDYEEIIP